MSLLERIKVTIFGEAVPPRVDPLDEGADSDSRQAGTHRTSSGYRPDVSTPADDPALDDVAASGVQPVSKPVTIEEAQNPVRRQPNLRD